MVIIYEKPTGDIRFGKNVSFASKADYETENPFSCMCLCGNGYCGKSATVQSPSGCIFLCVGCANTATGHFNLLSGCATTGCAHRVSVLHCLNKGFLRNTDGVWAVEACICYCANISGASNCISGNLASVSWEGCNTTETLCLEKNAGGCALVYWGATLINCDATGTDFNYTVCTHPPSPGNACSVHWPTCVKVVSGNVEFMRYNC